MSVTWGVHELLSFLSFLIGLMYRNMMRTLSISGDSSEIERVVKNLIKITE